jgi:hypothetical protein
MQLKSEYAIAVITPNHSNIFAFDMLVILRLPRMLQNLISFAILAGAFNNAARSRSRSGASLCDHWWQIQCLMQQLAGFSPEYGFRGAAAALGISALLVASHIAYTTIVKWAGAIYLIYFGVKMLWDSRKITHESVQGKISLENF